MNSGDDADELNEDLVDAAEVRGMRWCDAAVVNDGVVRREVVA